MLFELVAVLMALALGYFVTRYAQRQFGPPAPLRTSQSAPVLPVPLSKSPKSSSESRHSPRGAQEQPRTKELLKRGRTKDHVRNLQNLMLQKKSPQRSVSSPVTESEKDNVAAAAAVAEPEPESHPDFCPAVVPLTTEQQDKIEQLKERVADVMIPYFSERHTYVRFLGARQWDLDRAEAMLREAIAWRKTLEPIAKYRDLVSLSMAVQLSVVMEEKDRFGRTIVMFCPRRHNSKMRETDVALRIMVWFMDQLWRETRDTHYKKFVVLFNMKGFAMRNNDLQMVRGFLPILQNYYPEVVGRIIIVEYPFIIWGIWKMVKPLLDHNTQNKVQFIGPDELSQHFTPAAIPTEIGGEWEMPEAEVDLWADGFDYRAWKARPWEVIEEDGVYKRLPH